LSISKIDDELKDVKRSAPKSVALNSNINQSQVSKQRFKQKGKNKIMAKIKEKLDSSELKVQLDELILATSEIKDLMDSEGEQKVAELKAMSGKLNTLLTYDVTFTEMKSIITTAEAGDVIQAVKRGGDIVS